MTSRTPSVRTLLAPTALVTVVMLAACGGDSPPAEAGGSSDGSSEPVMSLEAMLEADQPIFGMFSGPQTPEQGRAIVANRETDFILYSMESGPFDVATMSAYMEAMDAAAAETGMSAQPVWLRVPAIHTDEAAAPERAAAALETGVDGIVFPHVTTAAEAATSVTLMGSPWPLGDAGLNVLIVEDREGVSTPTGGAERLQLPAVAFLQPLKTRARQRFRHRLHRMKHLIHGFWFQGQTHNQLSFGSI